MRGHRPTVVVYSRRGCGLCARAEALVATEARRADVEVVDVDTDPQLQTRYALRVPIVVVDGVELAAVELARGVVRRAVRRARRTWRIGSQGRDRLA